MATKKILVVMSAVMVITSLGYAVQCITKNTTACTLPCNKMTKAFGPKADTADITEDNDIYNNGMNLVFKSTLY